MLCKVENYTTKEMARETELDEIMEIEIDRAFVSSFKKGLEPADSSSSYYYEC